MGFVFLTFLIFCVVCFWFCFDFSYFWGFCCCLCLSSFYVFKHNVVIVTVLFNFDYTSGSFLNFFRYTLILFFIKNVSMYKLKSQRMLVFQQSMIIRWEALLYRISSLNGFWWNQITYKAMGSNTFQETYDADNLAKYETKLSIQLTRKHV